MVAATEVPADGYLVKVMENPEDADGRFVILDPSLKEGKYDEEHRKGKVEIKNDVLVLCDGETLDAEIGKHRLGYFLFWRN